MSRAEDPLEDFHKIFVAGMIITLSVIGIVAVTISYQTFSITYQSGTVTSITSDTQISYQTIHINGSHAFTEKVSCAGNFQFTVGDSVQYRYVPAVLFLPSMTQIDPLPSGCTVYST